CGALKKKGGEDAGEEGGAVAEVAAEAAAPVPATTALASNEGDIARFPDETAINQEKATFLRGINVREAPPAGPIAGTLQKGTSVLEIAARGGFFPVLSASQKRPGPKAMGWVSRDAFSAVIQDAGPLVCPTGEIALFGDTPFCGKLCTADRDCPASQ